MPISMIPSTLGIRHTSSRKPHEYPGPLATQASHPRRSSRCIQSSIRSGAGSTPIATAMLSLNSYSAACGAQPSAANSALPAIGTTSTSAKPVTTSVRSLQRWKLQRV